MGSISSSLATERSESTTSACSGMPSRALLRRYMLLLARQSTRSTPGWGGGVQDPHQRIHIRLELDDVAEGVDTIGGDAEMIAVL